MRSERERSAVADILKNIALAVEFVRDRSADELEKDTKSFYAAIRALEIISEASRRLSPDLKARHPDVPWQTIADAGNAYRHGYDVIAGERILTTVRLSTPQLRVALELESRSQPKTAN